MQAQNAERRKNVHFGTAKHSLNFQDTWTLMEWSSSWLFSYFFHFKKNHEIWERPLSEISTIPSKLSSISSPSFQAVPFAWSVFEPLPSCFLSPRRNTNDFLGPEEREETTTIVAARSIVVLRPARKTKTNKPVSCFASRESILFFLGGLRRFGCERAFVRKKHRRKKRVAGFYCCGHFNVVATRSCFWFWSYSFWRELCKYGDFVFRLELQQNLAKLCARLAPISMKCL